MKKYFLISILFAIFLTGGNVFAMNIKKVNKWAILLNYDAERNKNIDKILPNYDMLILDPDIHPDLENIRQKVLLIAYISLGEAATYRKYWKSMDKSLIIKANKNWKDAYFVDVSNKKWQKIILNEVIPDIEKQGFDGLFLDTIDTVDLIAQEYPTKYPNARKAMINLIKKIKIQYPKLKLISNNGFTIMDNICNSLDGVLVESLFGTFEYGTGAFGKNIYVETRANISREKLKKLTAIKARNKNHQIFVIDYADYKNKRYREYLYKKIKSYGFNPYIAEKELDNLYIMG